MPSAFADTVRTLYRQPHFPGLLGSTFALGIAFSFIFPFLSKWGTEAIGLSPSQLGLFMTATSVSSIVVSTILGRLSDTRLARKQILLLGSACGVIGFLGYAFLRNPWQLLALGCSVHAIASVCFAQRFAHLRETYRAPTSGAGNSSLSMSVVRVCFSFAWTIGPALGAILLVRWDSQGLLLQQTGLATALYANAGAVRNLTGMATFGFILKVFGHQSTFAICSAVCLLGAGFLGFARPHGSYSERF